MSLEMVDYIVNRYAYLGVASDASEDAIRKAIRMRRSAVHTDKLDAAFKGRNVDPSIIARTYKEAEKTNHALDDCAAILLTSKRTLFNERLAFFQEEKPELVRDDFIPVVVLGAGGFDLEKLMETSQGNIALLQQHLQQLTGFNEAGFQAVEQFYKVAPEQAKPLYIATLEKAYAYYSNCETIAWGAMGYHASPVKENYSPRDYAGHVSATVNQGVEAATLGILAQAETAQKIGLSASPLLLTYNVWVEQGKTQIKNPLAHYQQATDMLFERTEILMRERAVFLQESAAKTQEIMLKLMDLSSIHEVKSFEHTPKIGDKFNLLVFFPPNEEETDPRFFARCSSSVIGETQLILDSVSDRDSVTVIWSQLSEKDTGGIPTAACVLNKELPVAPQIAHYSEQFLERAFAL